MLVSIVTVNYNNAQGIEKTFQSVIGQTFKEYEMVVVDGGSTDGSREIIDHYRYTIADFHWVSEPDKGIYNAMNKGVKMASGEYCIFMNSGDRFFDENSLKRCVGYLDGSADIVSGAVMTDKFSKKAPSEKELSLTYFIKDSMNHQSTFIKRQLLLGHPYNEHRKIVADSELFFETLILGNASYRDTPVCVSYCEAAGASGDLQRSLEERMQAIKELLPPRMSYDSDFIQKYHNPIVLGTQSPNPH